MPPHSDAGRRCRRSRRSAGRGPILLYAQAFAAGAMIYVAIKELIPESHRERSSADLSMLDTVGGFTVIARHRGRLYSDDDPRHGAEAKWRRTWLSDSALSAEGLRACVKGPVSFWASRKRNFRVRRSIEFKQGLLLHRRQA